ncbi:UTRA domain-containing protein [Staphylococcus hominis]|uniref:UTRA domain-containing protein n=1 Tax=Staphylococcus hominis TaxID=1290 RepID=UPI001E405BE8|nr:UTRA domain-containing protein [Staphylococcus hominis]MCD8764451.1 UTRA domain-containing protein [Staphylococcus hominis]
MTIKNLAHKNEVLFTSNKNLDISFIINKVNIEIKDDFYQLIRPDNNVKEHLRLKDKNAHVYYVERIRYLDNHPLCIETSYFNTYLVNRLDNQIAASSIFEYLQSQLKINIGFSDIYFYIDFLSESEAPKLSLNPNDPCMRHELTFYTTTGIPFDYSNIVYHYKYANFFIPIES